MTDAMFDTAGKMIWQSADGDLWMLEGVKIEKLSISLPSNGIEGVLKFLGPDGEEIYRAQVLREINAKWGIKNPPPWLICQQMGRPYLLEQAR